MVSFLRIEQAYCCLTSVIWWELMLSMWLDFEKQQTLFFCSESLLFRWTSAFPSLFNHSLSPPFLRQLTAITNVSMVTWIASDALSIAMNWWEWIIGDEQAELCQVGFIKYISQIFHSLYELVRIGCATMNSNILYTEERDRGID